MIATLPLSRPMMRSFLLSKLNRTDANRCCFANQNSGQIPNLGNSGKLCACV
jgi:hypothetical protein